MGSYTSKTSEPQDRKPVDSDLISLGGSTLHGDTLPDLPAPNPRRQATHIPRNFGTALSHLHVSFARAMPIIGVTRNHFFNETGEINWYATLEVINTLWRLRIFFEEEGHRTCSTGYMREIREYRAAINLLAKSLYEMSLCVEPEMARKGMTELRRDSIRDLKARSKRGLEKFRAAIKDWRKAEALWIEMYEMANWVDRWRPVNIAGVGEEEVSGRERYLPFPGVTQNAPLSAEIA